ncbi:MAG: hypothetical protein DMD81_14545 [Candidatus Rokuibacteriota bacterium]|nr:MAG: hypothetical protein DMD81_14545 [Candidatus Rokubacteria bacterium]
MFGEEPPRDAVASFARPATSTGRGILDRSGPPRGVLIGGAASEAARVVADADLVVVGDIRTMDEERSQADGMAIKDGRIIYVGKASEARDRLRRGGRLIEARRGQVVLPGFIDSHVHMLEAGVLSLRCLLGEKDVKDKETMLEVIRKCAADHPELGMGGRERVDTHALRGRRAEEVGSGCRHPRPAGGLLRGRWAFGVAELGGSGRGGHHREDERPGGRADRAGRLERAERDVARVGDGPRREVHPEAAPGEIPGRPGQSAKGASLARPTAHRTTGTSSRTCSSSTPKTSRASPGSAWWRTSRRSGSSRTSGSTRTWCP